eukprot:CAMPEP_0206504784 /NCGR_PEP_ID=MMETSP0324_2-20121206/55719_1 /ASSEMBLY_ACC=CAM_ASM_000836 /TAXON_ID=2866 /ORGANISM="Crypthecodinium cohnii, Strain Seligo" /LENGTH=95 /DNA_ID=CAMNT_0053994075 /DNA_START=104 /DNA_END=387 /DNA_ORIENTATION=+
MPKAMNSGPGTTGSQMHTGPVAVRSAVLELLRVGDVDVEEGWHERERRARVDRAEGPEVGKKASFSPSGSGVGDADGRLVGAFICQTFLKRTGCG